MNALELEADDDSKAFKIRRPDAIRAAPGVAGIRRDLREARAQNE
jgi:hypothetical protein